MADTSTLPTWDLSDLFASLQDPKIAATLQQARTAATAFADSYKGKLATVGAERFVQAIHQYENLQEDLGMVISYAGLASAADRDSTEVAQFYQYAQEELTEISKPLLFFSLELASLDDAVYKAYLQHPDVARYQTWLDDVRKYRPHQLSDDLEALLHDKALTAQAWVRLFDETMSGLRIPFEGKDLTESDILHIIGSTTDAVRRGNAAKAFGQVLQDNQRTLCLIYNTLMKDKSIEDSWRKFATPSHSRHLSNSIKPAVVDALVTTVKSHYPTLSHRYYAIKAKWMGLEKLQYWDRNAPLPDIALPNYPWAEGKQIVLDAYHSFSPKLADTGDAFFKNAWIDVPPRAGKDSGAFAHPTVPKAHPYLLLNYHGSARDVMTLAHELGHGVHQVLAAKQGALLSDTPLTLAETASVFGEMLTFQAMLNTATDPQQRKALLARKVEDMLNTVIRQVAFYDFECKVHALRQQRELSPEDFTAIWLETQSSCLGDAVHIDPACHSYWSYIPHFIHTPFYVYAYAFGECLVNALFAVYQQQPEGFAEKYLDMLAAGGSKPYDVLLAPFGLNIEDPKFWAGGLQLISQYVDELAVL